MEIIGPQIQAEGICCKEALALYFVLQSVYDSLWDRRVTVTVDSKALYDAWGGLRARSTSLARVLKQIFGVTIETNCALRLRWVPSTENPADAPSRESSRADARLVQSIWAFLQRELSGNAGFTFDLMALPSNVPIGVGGLPLKFFSRSPAPGSAGEDVFAQKCPRDEELYVFPPFVMIGSLIGLFQEWGNVTVTMVVLRHPHPKSWWPYLCSFVQKPVRLAEMGQFGILEYPTANGYAPNE